MEKWKSDQTVIVAVAPKPMIGTYWAYFAPDGYLQVRTIGVSRAESRQFLPRPDESKTWRDYEKTGWVLRKVAVVIQPEGK